MEWIASPEAWIALFTLTVLEIVLGIDNIIFISILVDRLPEHQQKKARLTGLALAMVLRILLLLSISWVMGLTKDLFDVAGHGFSGRDLILLFGGLFLIWKSTQEIHHSLSGNTEAEQSTTVATYGSVLAQIAVLDLVFSLDSVITAVGMAKHVPVMVIAIVIAVGVICSSRYARLASSLVTSSGYSRVSIGSALLVAGLNHELYNCRKIHWLHLKYPGSVVFASRLQS